MCDSVEKKHREEAHGFPTSFSDSADCVPLVVDMDGSLLRTDSLWECFCAQTARHPWLVLLSLMWLARGPLYFKTRIAELGPPPEMPTRAEVVERCRQARSRGRCTILATASPMSVAKTVAARCGLFDEVVSSTKTVNLKGKHKANYLCKRFGYGNFDYIGDSPADIPVWKAARKAIIVGADSLLARVRAHHQDCELVPDKKIRLTDVFVLWRVQQWIKNFLVFVPLILAHRFTLHDVGIEILAFFSLCFMASAVYVLNDLCDIANDRSHPVKRLRPFASCRIPIKYAPILLGIPFILSLSLSLSRSHIASSKR